MGNLRRCCFVQQMARPAPKVLPCVFKISRTHRIAENRVLYFVKARCSMVWTSPLDRVSKPWSLQWA